MDIAALHSLFPVEIYVAVLVHNIIWSMVWRQKCDISSARPLLLLFYS